MSSSEKKSAESNNRLSTRRLARLGQQLRRLAAYFPRRSQDVIAANVAEDARNVVVGKNIVQIGSLKIPWLLAFVLGAGAIVGVTALIWIGVNAQRVSQAVSAPTPTATPTSTSVPTATPVPDRMNGAFNIAVADFGEIDASGVVSDSQDGRILSAWVYNALEKAYRENPATQGLGPVQIWSDSTEIPGKNQPLGPVIGALPQERRQAAEALASHINATMVIYGAIDARVSPADLWLEFYVAPDLQRALDPAVGQHSLGAPIGVKLPIDAANPLTGISIANALTARTSLLFWLTAGMTYDLLGKNEDALQSFQQAGQTLAEAGQESGRDLVNFYIGRQYLTMQQYESAIEAYQQALHDNATYARAQVGLGGVYFAQAQLQPEERPSAESERNLALALQTYTEAVELAQAEGDPQMIAIGQLALASTYRLQAQSLDLQGNLNEAQQAYDQAITEITSLLPELVRANEYRLLGQAYESLGIAHLQLSDLVRRQDDLESKRAHLGMAVKAFDNCIKQGAEVPFDQYLVNKIIKNSCQPYWEISQRALEDMGES